MKEAEEKNRKAAIQTDKAAPAIGPYSQGIRTEQFLFSSGQIPLKPDGSLETGSVEAQTKQVLENLKAVLEAGGTSLDKVVKCTCFLADMNDFAAMNGVYSEYFTGTAPARSAVEVARLPKDVKIEIEAIALI